jgi:predicted NAD-dependent protein-ADP-ribosyltransferase YbiA (DUF1768 family)
LLAAALSQLHTITLLAAPLRKRASKMSSQPWGDKRWSRETKRRRLAQARAVMDQIDEKYKSKEEEQYLDPDKGFAELRDPTAPRPIADDKDAIKSFKGDFAFLAPDAKCRVAVPSCFGPVALDDDVPPDSKPYPSLEHAFQAVRSNDGAAVRRCETSRDAKRIGAKAFKKRSDQDAFRAKAVDVMDALIRDRFARADRDALLATGTRRLRHGNEYGDGYWGLKGDGSGRNELGKALERCRDLCQNEKNFWLAWCGDRVSNVDERDSAFDACWRREGDAKLQMLPAVEEALSLVLGRREDSPLPLDHASISRFHACAVNACGGVDDGAYALVDLGSAHGTFVHRKGRSPKRLEPFVFYKMTKRDEVQFGASSKRFRLVADCERRRRKADRLAGRMASQSVWKSTSRHRAEAATETTSHRWRGPPEI